MRALGTPKYMCMDNIEMELRGLEWGQMDPIYLDKNTDEQKMALVNSVTNLVVS